MSSEVVPATPSDEYAPGAPPGEPPPPPGHDRPCSAYHWRRSELPMHRLLSTGFGFGTGFWARCSQSCVSHSAWAAACAAIAPSSILTTDAIATRGRSASSLAVGVATFAAKIGAAVPETAAAWVVRRPGPPPPMNGSTTTSTALIAAMRKADRFMVPPGSIQAQSPRTARAFVLTLDPERSTPQAFRGTRPKVPPPFWGRESPPKSPEMRTPGIVRPGYSGSDQQVAQRAAARANSYGSFGTPPCVMAK